MTVKTSDLGGSNWNDGDVAYAADFNDTFGAVTLHRKQFSDATERSYTGTSYADSGTAFTLSIPVNSMVIGILFTFDIVNDTSGINQLSIKISGSNFGTKYYQMKGDTGYSQLMLRTTESNTFANTNSTYATFSIPAFIPFKVLDSSMPFTFRIAASAGQVSLRNVMMDVLYTEAYKED